jgi:carbonic anhydrase
MAQVRHVCHTSIVQNAWSRGERLCVHGWAYKLSDGLLQDLDCAISSAEQLDRIYRVGEAAEDE